MKRAFTIVCCAAAVALTACGKEKPSSPAGSAASAERNPLAVTAPAPLLADLQLGEPPLTEVRDALRVPGRIEVDEQRVARVGSSVVGRITELTALVGQDVKRGEILAEISSTELSATQLDYLKAFSQQQLAERSVQRAQQLYEADVIGQAELQRRQNELSQTEAEVSAARDQLKVLGMSETSVRRLAATRRVNSQSQVVASISGTVIERQGTLGQVVQPADTIYIVADLSNVWLVADVPEAHASLVRIGETVQADIAALGGERVGGTLTFVSATVNPQTRTIKVRMDLANEDRRFKPAMLATVLIQGKPQKLRVVPSTAVVREENKDFVFVQTAPNEFVLRQVVLGPEQGGQRTLLSGWREGDKVVLDGAFGLNVERQRSLTQ
jgi:cobalt-zinc-cadmium efflux system membrane fusion protein